MSMKKMLAVVAAASLVAVAAPAFAANPFSDVPMNHWAYDAVEQLSAKGVIDGYPNGTFKGNRAMTRYEIATVVARMMANGVGGADADKLKALIVEFAPELEALGVKVDGFDGRLAKLEKGLGGLRIWGQMRFDVLHHDDASGKGGWSDNGTGMNRARLFMSRELANGVSWDLRVHANKIDRYFVTAKDLFGVDGLKTVIGQYTLDLEGNDNLYATTNWHDDDAFFLDTSVRGVKLAYKRGAFEVEGNYFSNQDAGDKGVYSDNMGKENYTARIAYNGAKLHASLNGYWVNDNGDNATWSVNYAAVGYKPFAGIDIVGAYFWEDMPENDIDDPKAWKAVIDVKQSVLKFTSLRAEYADFDEGFYVQTGPMSWSAADTNKFGTFKADATYLKVEAAQKWNAKFTTFERYAHVDVDDAGKAKELQLGVGYQYTPNLWFAVDYVKCDGQLKSGTVNEDVDDKVVRFRTILNF